MRNNFKYKKNIVSKKTKDIIKFKSIIIVLQIKVKKKIFIIRLK